jgi:hypothetical protein
MMPSDKSEFDVMCIYCPETDACYHLRSSDHRQSVTLRVVATRNGQTVGVLPSEEQRTVPDRAARTRDRWPKG